MTNGRVDSTPVSQRAMILLSGAVVGLVVVLGLQWGRPILIPIALAVLLTFLLNPVVRSLERRGLGRGFSVTVTVFTVVVVLLCLGWMVTRQVAGLLSTLPQNTANIKAKVKTLQALGSGQLADQFEEMVGEISQELQRPFHAKHAAIDDDGDLSKTPPAAPTEVLPSRMGSTFWLRVTGYLGSAAEVFVTLTFSMVLVVFFLVEREDLRDRIVLLAGKARLALTSKALEDISDRISRYIVVVAMVNGGFGVLMTVGLLILGVPYALLWGFLAAGLRFLPYIGPWIGAVFPIIMSLATFEGWWQPLAVIAYVMILEAISNNVLEPLVVGRSTGVSPIALLISAAFWLYLWGPIGLVLSAPLAVCFVVLGKNIEQFNFLNLLLGDAPALHTHLGIYQRLMLGEEAETVRLVLQRMKDLPSDGVYDELLIPALNYTKRDLRRDYLTDSDRQTILKGLRQSLLQAEQFRISEPADTTVTDQHATDTSCAVSIDSIKPITVLGCPGMDDTDALGLEMLRQVINPVHCNLDVTPVQMSIADLVARVQDHPPDIICVASLPPGGMTHAVYICKRLRAKSPEVQIIVGRWGQKHVNKIERERLERAGANFVTTTLLETRDLLESSSSVKLLKLPTLLTMQVREREMKVLATSQAQATATHHAPFPAE